MTHSKLLLLVESKLFPQHLQTLLFYRLEQFEMTFAVITWINISIPLNVKWRELGTVVVIWLQWKKADACPSALCEYMDMFDDGAFIRCIFRIACHIVKWHFRRPLIHCSSSITASVLQWPKNKPIIMLEHFVSPFLKWFRCSSRTSVEWSPTKPLLRLLTDLCKHSDAIPSLV